MLKLRVLTGVPGSGKSSSANEIAAQFHPDWMVVHADDAIGPTFACYSRPWAQIRSLHPFFTGWTAGWNLTERRNVLVEGHLKDETEIRNLIAGVRDLYRGPLDTRVGFLDGDVEEIARRLAGNPYREPAWVGPKRLANFKEWITAWPIDPSIANVLVDGRGKTKRSVAAEVAKALDLPYAP